MYLVKLLPYEKLINHTNLVVAWNQKMVYNRITQGVNIPIKLSALKLIF